MGNREEGLRWVEQAAAAEIAERCVNYAASILSAVKRSLNA